MGFLVYFVFGLYFINMALGFVVFPEIMLKVDKYILLVGAVLIFIGAINYFRISNIQKLKIN